MGLVRSTAVGSAAPKSLPVSVSAWSPWKQARARPVPAPPHSPRKRTLAHTSTRAAIWGAPGAPKSTLNAPKNKLGRRVQKRARVMFEIQTLRAIISEHSDLREGKAFTPKPYRCLHLHTQDLLVLSFSCVARYWRASSNTSGDAKSSPCVIS